MHVLVLLPLLAALADALPQVGVSTDPTVLAGDISLHDQLLSTIAEGITLPVGHTISGIEIESVRVTTQPFGNMRRQQGVDVSSPGVVSGNVIQVPVHVPVNVCGNTVSVIGLLNPAFGNDCVNSGVDLNVSVK